MILFTKYIQKITGIFNIGSGKGLTVKEFIKKKLNFKSKIISDNKINSLVSNNNKLKRTLNANKI